MLRHMDTNLAPRTDNSGSGRQVGPKREDPGHPRRGKCRIRTQVFADVLRLTRLAVKLAGENWHHG